MVHPSDLHLEPSDFTTEEVHALNKLFAAQEAVGLRAYKQKFTCGNCGTEVEAGAFKRGKKGDDQSARVLQHQHFCAQVRVSLLHSDLLMYTCV